MTRGTKDVSHLRATLSLQSRAARDVIPSSPCTGIPATAPSFDHYRPAGLLTLLFLVSYLSLYSSSLFKYSSKCTPYLCKSWVFMPWFLSRGLPRTTFIRAHTFCANTSVEPFLCQEFPSIFSHSFLISPLFPSILGISSFLSISPNLNRNIFSHNFHSNKRAVFSSVKVSGDTILCLPNPHYSPLFFFFKFLEQLCFSTSNHHDSTKPCASEESPLGSQLQLLWFSH